MRRLIRSLLIIFVQCLIIIHGRTLITSHADPSTVKHFETLLDPTEGFWSPSTSSIDWCERNYAVTYYLAEFWNCLSSLLMSVFAAILFIRGVYYQLESRFLLLSVSFGIVGLGSAYFHGTLTHLGQMADELPMVYSMIIWWYILFKMNQLRREKHSVLDLSVVLGIAYGLFWTYIHKLKSFVLIFQVHFTLMVFGGILRLVYLYRQRLYHTSAIFYLILSYVGFILIASICWILDQHFCERFNQTSHFNPQLHAWWHVLCAVDCHCGIVCAEAMRYLSIKSQQEVNLSKSQEQLFQPHEHLRLIFFCGLPFVDYSDERQANNKKK